MTCPGVVVSNFSFRLGVLLLALVAVVPSAAADTWSSAGPTGGGVRSLAVDPGAPQTAYAATPGGVWRTTDGTTWTRVLAVPARDVAVDATRVVAATDGGVWRSTDDGLTWLRSTEGMAGEADRDVRSVGLGASPVIYAGTRRGVLQSADGGVTWSTASTGIPDGTAVADLAVAGATLYAAAADGVYVSGNGAGSWTGPVGGLTGPAVSVALDVATPARVWVVEADGVLSGSTTSGAAWTPTPLTDARAVATRAGAPTTVYAATDDGARRSTSSGTSFSAPPAAVDDRPLSAIAASAGTAYAAGDRDGVFRSPDDAVGWLATGLLSATSVTAVAFDPGSTAAPRTLWSAGAAGVLRSVDGGATWERRETGLPARPVPRDLAVDPRTPGTLYAALGGGVWRSVDAGGTWVAASTGLPSTDVRVLAVDPQTPGRLLAGTATGLARSANGGATWTAGTGLPVLAVTAAAVDPADPTIALAGTAGQGVWRSSDAGATWTTASTGPLAGAAVASLLPTSTVVLAGTDRGVFRSTDRGATWTRVTAGLPEGLVASGFWQHPAVATTLALAAGADGLYRSLDDGASWYRDDAGLDARPSELAGDARALAAATSGDGVRLATLRRDLTLTASAHPAPVVAGELVTLTFGIGNRGPSPSTGTRVAMTLPAGFAVREATSSQGTCTTEPLQCDLGTMGVGGIATATVIVRSTVAGTVPVTIAASAEQPDRTPADDTRALDVQSTDTTPPRSLRVRGTTLQRPFQTGTDIQLGWSAVDSGTGVFRYDVRYRRATAAGRFDAGVLWQERTARTTALFSGGAGFTYCFSVRAVDGAGNESRFSTEKCTAIPLDDTALARRGAWAREGNKTAFNGATIKSTRRGASLVLRNVRAKRISLLATTCKRCGTVEVRLGARLLKTVSLDAKTTRTRQILPVLVATGLRSGTLTIKVTTNGRPVRIDGLGLSPR